MDINIVILYYCFVDTVQHAFMCINTMSDDVYKLNGMRWSIEHKMVVDSVHHVSCLVPAFSVTSA